MEKVEIFDVSYEGAGVGKVGGQVIFVPKVLPGEVANVETVGHGSKFLRGKAVDILTENEHRIEPKCPYFDICGGCAFQNCDREYEKSLKIQILRAEIKKVGFGGEIAFVSDENRYFYRNKIKLEVSNGKIGYFSPKSHDFFEIKCCPIASEKINEVIPLVAEVVTENALPSLSSVYIKETGNDLGVCFLFDKNDKTTQKKLKKIEKLHPHSVFFAFGDVLESNETKIFCIFGKDKLTKSFDDFSADFEISAFNQINDAVATKLYADICQMTSGKRVVNAYSGQGLLSFLISKNAKFVYGIEYQNSAHQAAEKLKIQVPDFKIENICGRVEDKLPLILLRDHIDILVLDPSREGCKKEVLDQISKSKVQSVIYVACNFASLVRDLRILQDFYEIKGVAIYDMFPCCVDMETVAVLQRKSGV